MLVLVVLAAATVVLADGRVALVVGNSTYAHIGGFPNPENDAVDVTPTWRLNDARFEDRDTICPPRRRLRSGLPRPDTRGRADGEAETRDPEPLHSPASWAKMPKVAERSEEKQP